MKQSHAVNGAFCFVPVDLRSGPRELHEKTECPITSYPGLPHLRSGDQRSLLNYPPKIDFANKLDKAVYLAWQPRAIVAVADNVTWHLGADQPQEEKGL